MNENKLKRFGEEALLKALDIKVELRVTSDHWISLSREEMDKYITSPSISILFNGGGFGDRFSGKWIKRNNFLTWYQNNQIIMFPQSIHYFNATFIEYDRDIFYMNQNLHLTLRTFDSYAFALKHFSQSHISFTPEISFMLGDLTKKPIQSKYDFLIFRRTDIDSAAEEITWRYEISNLKYSYIDADWYMKRDLQNILNMGYYKNETSKENMTMIMKQIMDQRKEVVKTFMSRGKVIITDRLHTSIYAILIDKPHVIIDDKKKKVSSVREDAFRDKPECESRFLRAQYAENPKDAIQKAIQLLHYYYY